MKDALEHFYATVKCKRVTVLGIGVSNRPLIKMLLASGADVTARDKKSFAELGEIASELEERGAKLQLGEDYLMDIVADIIFRTPGMRYDVPQLVEAAAGGTIITSEMEVFFDVCPCRIIAVTGSDGKSTTTTLISELLKHQGYTVHVGGNLGRPLLEDAGTMKETDVAVLELSSFQLHTMKKSPHIAVVTNITPNHLDVHLSMEEYVDAKSNIFMHQGKEDLLVLNADNAITRSYAESAQGRVKLFSRLRKEAVYADQRGNIYCGDLQVVKRDGLLLRGDHNVENMMAAIAAVWDLVETETIAKVAATFTGLPHRLEFVRELNGVQYINDSIASSPTRTIACLNAFEEKPILILGGYDKKIPFDELGNALCERAKAVVITGDTAEAIERAVLNSPAYNEHHPIVARAVDLEAAVSAASQLAVSGDRVVLSPACASFDRYQNFEKRGEHYKQTVLNLE